MALVSYLIVISPSSELMLSTVFLFLMATAILKKLPLATQRLNQPMETFTVIVSAMKSPSSSMISAVLKVVFFKEKSPYPRLTLAEDSSLSFGR